MTQEERIKNLDAIRTNMKKVRDKFESEMAQLKREFSTYATGCTHVRVDGSSAKYRAYDLKGCWICEP